MYLVEKKNECSLKQSLVQSYGRVLGPVILGFKDNLILFTVSLPSTKM